MRACQFWGRPSAAGQAPGRRLAGPRPQRSPGRIPRRVQETLASGGRGRYTHSERPARPPHTGRLGGADRRRAPARRSDEDEKTMHRRLLFLLLTLQVAGQAFPAGLVLCLGADGTVCVEPAGGGFPGSAPCGPASCAGWCVEAPGCPPADGSPVRLDAVPACLAPGDGDGCSDLSLCPFPGLRGSGPTPGDGSVPPAAAPDLAALPAGAPADDGGRLPEPSGEGPLPASPTDRIHPLRI